MFRSIGLFFRKRSVSNSFGKMTSMRLRDLQKTLENDQEHFTSPSSSHKRKRISEGEENIKSPQTRDWGQMLKCPSEFDVLKNRFSHTRRHWEGEWRASRTLTRSYETRLWVMWLWFWVWASKRGGEGKYDTSNCNIKGTNRTKKLHSSTMMKSKEWGLSARP